MMTKNHHYPMIMMSPWPILSSLNTFVTFLSLLMMLKYNYNKAMILSIFNIAMIMYSWWITFSSEFNLNGMSSKFLESGVKFSMIMFILSEVFFFFSFFWSYFHFFLAPIMELGFYWPPFPIQMFSYMDIPLINTMLLLMSGITITISHKYLTSKTMMKSLNYLWLTMTLGTLFSYLQYMEYNNSFFSMSDSSFGTLFFILTGFHGLHVIIGTMFLLTSYYRCCYKMTFTAENSLSFEMSAWYWHFVDIVWIFLYFFIYYMNN